MKNVIAGIISLQGILLAAYAVIGGYCASYSLWVLFGKDIPWFLDIALGMLFGYVIIPMTVILAVLQSAGVIVSPLFQQ